MLLLWNFWFHVFSQPRILRYSLQDKDSHFAFAGGGGDCNDGKSATRKKRNKKEEEAVVQWLV